MHNYTAIHTHIHTPLSFCDLFSPSYLEVHLLDFICSNTVDLRFAVQQRTEEVVGTQLYQHPSQSTNLDNWELTLLQ